MFKEEEVFGAYRADPNTVITEYTSWFEQPKGFFYRGKYSGKLYFSDVQHIVHMILDLQINIAKNWGWVNDVSSRLASLLYIINQLMEWTGYN